MGQPEYIRKAHGSPDEVIRVLQEHGTSVRIVHTRAVEVGTYFIHYSIIRNRATVAVSPYSDYAQPDGWKEVIEEEYAKSKVYIRNLVNKTRIKLGLPV